MLIELLPRMLEAARINRPYQLYQLPSGGGGSLLANGSWSGVMGELTARRADLAMFPLTLTSARSQAISATVPFLDSGYAMLVKITQQDNAYSFLLPFQRDTWLLILAALAAVILTATLLHSWTRRARHAALERQYGLGREAPRRRRHERVMQHGIETTVITLSAYTANLTANLTVSRLGVSIQTLADLKRSGNMFGVPFDSSVSKYFRASNDGVANSLQASMVEYRDQAAAVRDVRSGAIAAYVTDFPGGAP
ncbi:hypothetical protein MNEG_7263 [Monoraphidium neglectum]|uniref:Ionotropic glutamate receptor L-glutamate and glycine-binding domain-containing protein n=1 Tax=Monoraphidium neglectum TaxID=145388 RepID=A0A0D2JNI6_9CHLO|nr:hypothetical protein MNEG_7263 [Monoraphidium neglectum]KIZ00703.1 hypothetical protein MNEG_7263 [Monoraphidium neglectum]|eukprot:XP_013899722.1 hypothetical protein MNEG_7263 [Monoraphidium neglectum]